MRDEKRPGVILSYITLAANILIQFLYTPIMLRLLGQSEYGLYTLSNSVISYITLFDMGFAGSYLRFYASYSVKKDDEGIKRLNSTYLFLFIVLSSMALLCGIILSLQVDNIFSNKLTSEELQKARGIMLILTISLFFSLLSNVFSSIITAYERFYRLKIVKLLQTVFSPVIGIPLMLLGYGSVSLAIASLITSVWCFLEYAKYCIIDLKVHFNLKLISLKLIKSVGAFSFFIFLNEIISQINWSVDKVLLGIYHGTIMTAIYGVGSQIDMVYRSLSSSISSVFAPRVNNIVARNGNDKELTDLFCRIGRIQFIILAPVLLGFIGFGKYFIFLWAGKDYSSSYYVTLLLIVPVTIPLIQNLGIEIQRAKNKHQFRSIIYTFMAIVNVLISIPLCKKWEAVGCAIGTSLSLIIGNVMIMNWFYSKKLGIGIKEFWMELLDLSKGLIPSICFIVAILLIPINWNIWLFIILFICFAFVYLVSMWKFGMNESEIALVNSMLRKIKHMRRTGNDSNKE